MKLRKLLVVTIALVSSCGLFAREFVITLDQNAGFVTKKGEGAVEEQNMKITSDGGMLPFHVLPWHHKTPTYYGICKAVVNKFKLDAKAEDLKVFYMNPNTGAMELLEPAITYETKKGKIKNSKPKQRDEFFASIKNPETGKVDLFVTWATMEPMVMEESEIENEDMME